MAGLSASVLAKINGARPAARRAGKGREIPDDMMPAPKGVIARGQLAKRRMNRTEAAYAQHLERLRLGGEILWWAFEAIKLRLADGTYLTPDFAVLTAEGEIELRDTKGFLEEDAAVKLKVARGLFPFRFAIVKSVKGGGWKVTYVEGRIRA